jgi:hypothetical protein
MFVSRNASLELHSRKSIKDLCINFIIAFVGCRCC